MKKIEFVSWSVLMAFLTACQMGTVQHKNKPAIVSSKPDFSVKFNPVSKQYAQMVSDSAGSFFYKHLNLGDLNGMFLIAKNGQILVEHYQGFANEEMKVKMGPETPIHVASISKVITAITVLRLVDQGKIALDKDIRSYIPEIPYEGVTVRSLLNHRSGIPYYGYFPIEVLPATLTLTNRSLVDLINRHRFPLYFPANTQFSYCNTNYALLAVIVEQVMHKPFPLAVDELVFEPLKMTHSFVYTTERENPTISRSYNESGVQEPVTNLDIVYGDKNVYTTVRDLLLLDKATYSNAFLSSSIREQLYKGYSYEHPGKSNYGLGMRMREEQGKSIFFFHTGWWHGNTGCYASLRADTVCMIVLSNHYTKKVFNLNKLATFFGNYPFEPLIDQKENFIQPTAAKDHLKATLKQ
jgi:CubicO group peptidase (beta-lactamase class C family)